MKYLKIYFFLIITFLPILGCQRSSNLLDEIDNKSYINDFELLQQNPNTQTKVKITSPKAIIDPLNNDIEIFDSFIEIINQTGDVFNINSGNSTLDNLSNSIRVFNNVNLSFFDNHDYYITTDAFEWDLNTSVININNPVNLIFDNTWIKSSNGFYNIDSSQLEMSNVELNRNIYNPNGNEEYQIKIKSDITKWFKRKNTLVFVSNVKQVETTINFLPAK